MAACPNGCLRTFRRCAALLALGLGLLALASSPLPMPAWEAALGAGAMSLAFAAAVYRLVLTPLLDSRGQRTEDAASLLRQQAELDALQSQINPHFLYNTLDSIRGQALAEGAEDIANMTEALSTFFRYSISNRSNVVTLEEELENIRSYFMIQQFRFNNRFRLEMPEFPKDLLEACRLPKLTLQPILENTILHGMEGKIGQGVITLRVEQTGNRTLITVSDDGAGMREETLLRLQAKLRDEEPVPLERKQGSGIALPNVNRRIKLLFGPEYGVRIMSTLGLGTDVEISLPPCGGEDADG